MSDLLSARVIGIVEVEAGPQTLEAIRAISSAQSHVEITGLLHRIVKTEEKIMGLIDDLRSAQVEQNTKLDLVTNEVQVVAAEVADLITKIGTGSGGLTADDVATAQATSARLTALSDALLAIPPAPGPTPPPPPASGAPFRSR